MNHLIGSTLVSTNMNLYCLLVSFAQPSTKESISPYFSYSISTVIRRVLFMKVPPKTFAKKTRLLRKDGSGELHELPNDINQTKCFGKTWSSSESGSYQVVTTGPESVITLNLKRRYSRIEKGWKLALTFVDLLLYFYNRVYLELRRKYMGLMNFRSDSQLCYLEYFFLYWDIQFLFYFFIIFYAILSFWKYVWDSIFAFFLFTIFPIVFRLLVACLVGIYYAQFKCFRNVHL